MSYVQTECSEQMDAPALQMSGALSPSDRDGEGPKIFGQKFWKTPTKTPTVDCHTYRNNCLPSSRDTDLPPSDNHLRDICIQHNQHNKHNE